MYQSVGHEIIDLIGRAMELPLYRAEIKGDAQTTEKEYRQPVQGDEVEDLFALLAEIKASEQALDCICSRVGLGQARRGSRLSRCDLLRVSKQSRR